MSLLSKPILIIILTTLLALYFTESSAQVIFEAKKAYEINSPKVCGDRLCSELSSKSPQVVKSQKNTDSPLGQFFLGITLDKIRCKADYQLVIKAVNWRPACVNPPNVQKLIEIGWAVSNIQQEEIIKLAKSGYSFDIVERLGIPQPNATQLETQSLLDSDFGLNIQPDIQDGQRYLIFTGHGWMGFHVITIHITNEQGYFSELETKTAQSGDLFMPWLIPEDLPGGWYHIYAFEGEGQHKTFEIDIPISSGESISTKKTAVTDDNCTTETFPIDWSGCDLYGRILTNVDLRSANLVSANLYGVTLSNKDLTGADFTSAMLKSGNFDGAILRGASFVNANLVDSEIRNADLSSANFRNAKLFRTDFTNSNLTNADMRYSTLSYAILASVDLKGANLEGAGTWETNLNHCYNHAICE